MRRCSNIFYAFLKPYWIVVIIQIVKQNPQPYTPIFTMYWAYTSEKFGKRKHISSVLT